MTIGFGREGLASGMDNMFVLYMMGFWLWGDVGGGRILEVSCAGGLLRMHSLRGTCSGRNIPAGTLGKVAFSILDNRCLKVVKTDNSKGAALLGYVTAIVGPASKRVLLSKTGVDTFSNTGLTRCHKGEVNCLFRSFTLLSGLANERGVLLPLSVRGVSDSVTRGRLGSVTKFLKVASILSGFPTRVSNNRGRHMTTTHDLVSGPSVVLTSRPANTLSAGTTQLLVRGLRRIGRIRKHAVLVIARSPGTTDFYSHVLFVRSNIVFRRLHHGIPARAQRRFCTHVLRMVTRVKKKDTGILWPYVRGFRA